MSQIEAAHHLIDTAQPPTWGRIGRLIASRRKLTNTLR
jgi:hypothetical protein